MGIVSLIVLLINIVVLAVINITFFALDPLCLGVSGLLGTVAFFIGYAVSMEVTIAPRDFWVNPEFGVFMKKLGFAWTCGVTTWGLATVLIGHFGST